MLNETSIGKTFTCGINGHKIEIVQQYGRILGGMFCGLNLNTKKYVTINESGNFVARHIGNYLL